MSTRAHFLSSGRQVLGGEVVNRDVVAFLEVSLARFDAFVGAALMRRVLQGCDGTIT